MVASCPIPKDAAPGAYVCVLIVEDESGTRSYKLDRATYSIGRSSEASIQIKGKTCSRRQATLVQTQGRSGTPKSLPSYKIFDGDLSTQHPSANGTLVNGYPVESQVLRHEDIIWLGAEVKATFLQLSRELIPEGQRDFQTLVIQIHFNSQRRQTCYVAPSGETIVTQKRTRNAPGPVVSPRR